jgi:hypothetical protein
MGFFKILRDTLRSEPSPPSSQSENASQTPRQVNSPGMSTDRLPPRSAPPGRMEKTDVIRGPECRIPRGPSAYRHIDKQTKEILYVGQSNDLRVRQQQHARAGRLDTTKHDVQKHRLGKMQPRTTCAGPSGATLLGTSRPATKRRGGNGRR